MARGGGSGTGYLHSVKGANGNDTLAPPAGALLTQVAFDGGRGNDTLNLSNYGSGVQILIDESPKVLSTVTLRPFQGIAPGFYQLDSTTVKGSINNIENIVGTAFNDYLFAGSISTAKRIDGGPGNDAINALGALATSIGGTGSDWLMSTGVGTILIGGTYAGNVAVGDGEKDYFFVSSAPTILDFEVGIDRLFFDNGGVTIASFETGQWLSDGAGGATFWVNGAKEVTLANVGPLTAQGIELGFLIAPTNGVTNSSPYDDMIFAQTGVVDRIVLDANDGDDVTIGFNLLTDILVFADGLVPEWSNSFVNGQEALVGTYAGGSITLPGLDTGDVAALHIEGPIAPPAFGSDAMGAWSVPSDALLFLA